MSTIVDQTEIIDGVTGEVTRTEVRKKFRSDEPNYIKLYLKDIAYLHDLPATASGLLHELLNYVTYGTQEIVLNSTAKKRICVSVGVAMKTLNNRLQALNKKGIIERVDMGTYRLNPYLFGKGDWKSIKELRDTNVHLEIVYDAESNERVIRGGFHAE